MTHEEKGAAMEAVLRPVFERGFDGIGEVLSVVLNFAMLMEREKGLGAQPYERTGGADVFERMNWMKTLKAQHSALLREGYAGQALNVHVMGQN